MNTLTKKQLAENFINKLWSDYANTINSVSHNNSGAFAKQQKIKAEKLLSQFQFAIRK